MITVYFEQSILRQIQIEKKTKRDKTSDYHQRERNIVCIQNTSSSSDRSGKFAFGRIQRIVLIKEIKS